MGAVVSLAEGSVIGPFEDNAPAFGDALDLARELPDESVNCIVTSPPYWGLRNYGVDGQLGLERTPEEYVDKMVVLFRELRRSLREDGTLWLNLGDCYASTIKGSGGPSEKQLSNAGSRYEMTQQFDHGLKPKDLVGIPWRVAFALQTDGWYLRSDIIWSKPNPMPESVTDRPTKSHEYIFLMAKSERYYYDADAIRENFADERMGNPGKYTRSPHPDNPYKNQNNECPDLFLNGGRNRRSVWTITTKPYPGAHFATFPPDLINPCILAGCPEGGIVLDPFLGSGTTGMVCQQLGRRWIGFELNQEYEPLIIERTRQQGLFGRAL